MDRFNKWLAKKITDGVATMWCAYVFCFLALLGLPPALKPNGEGLIAWIAQTFIQLVLLSVIMVGQKLQAQSTTTTIETHLKKHHDLHMIELNRIKHHLGIKEN